MQISEFLEHNLGNFFKKKVVSFVKKKKTIFILYWNITD